MSIIRYRFICLVIFFLVSQCWAFNTTSDLSVEELRNVLDSLELKIQEKRRAGEAIDKLMRETETVKAAIENENIRLKKSGGVKQRTETPTKKTTSVTKKLPKPVSLIDWLIVIVGVVAVVALALLIIFQLVNLTRKRRLKKQVKVKPVKYTTSTNTKNESETIHNAKNDTVTTPAAPDWVAAMRSYTPENNGPSPKPDEVVISPEVVTETTRNEASFGTTRETLEDEIDKAMNETVFESSINENIDTEPIVHLQASVGRDDLVKELLTKPVSDQPLEDHFEQLEKLIVEDAPVENKVEPISEPFEEKPKTRAQQVKEVILDQFDKGKTPVDIARNVGMSVGEIELVLTLARRM